MANDKLYYIRSGHFCCLNNSVKKREFGGLSVDKINRILDYLYSALANETQQPENTNTRLLQG